MLVPYVTDDTNEAYYNQESVTISTEIAVHGKAMDRYEMPLSVENKGSGVC